VVTFAGCVPGPLCYNPVNNHLYCLDDIGGLLFIIDGDSNHLLKTLKIPMDGYGYDTLIWNPVSNKAYFTNAGDRTVSILDCASDSIVATLETGLYPWALCYNEDGTVYVANEGGGGVTVIDGSGDTVRTVVPIDDHPRSICCDRADNKVYVSGGSARVVKVISGYGDSVVATIPVPFSDYATVCWNRNHNKVYVSGPYSDSLAVIDCAGDTVLRNIRVTTGLDRMYSDSVCDKVYCADNDRGYLRIIRAATDTFYKNLNVGYVTALLDNGKQGPANRLYCVEREAAMVTVVGAYKMDSVLCRIAVGNYPVALAWNPAHSRMYVSNSGSSSITVIRDTFGMGVEESQPQATGHKPQATVVRGVLDLEVDSRQQAEYRAELLDASGRKVMDLKPGANDVRALAPGVYFVRDEGRGTRDSGQTHKVVVTR